MNFFFYENCRTFLEKMISEHPENQFLIQAYTTLISKIAEVEINYSQNTTDFNKVHNTNQVDFAKIQHQSNNELAKVYAQRPAAIPPYA